MDAYTFLARQGLGIKIYFTGLLLSFILLIPAVYFQTHHRFHDESTKIEAFEDWLDDQFNIPDDAPDGANTKLRAAFQEYNKELEDLSLQEEDYLGKFEEIIQKAKESLHRTSLSELSLTDLDRYLNRRLNRLVIHSHAEGFELKEHDWERVELQREIDELKRNMDDQ